MRKQTLCICENKEADQLLGNREADLRAFVFATLIVQSLYFLNPKFQASSHLRSCTAWFVSDQVGNHNVIFLMTWLNFHIFLTFFYINNVHQRIIKLILRHGQMAKK